VKTKKEKVTASESKILKTITFGYKQKRWVLAYQALIGLPNCQERITCEIFQNLFISSKDEFELAKKISRYLSTASKCNIHDRTPHRKIRCRKERSVENGMENIYEAFNPADYDYFDSLSDKGWIWEFERRKDEYEKTYQSVVDRINSIVNDEGASKINAWDVMSPSLADDLFAPLLCHHNVMINLSASEISLKFEFKEWPRRRVGYFDIPYPPAPDVRFSDLPSFITVKAKPFIKAWTFPASSIAHPNDCLYIMNSVLVPDLDRKESTLYIGVDLKSKMVDIMREIREAVQRAKVGLGLMRETKKPSEWKKYLMVYDLRRQGFRNDAIAAYLFPDINNPAKKATEHFKKAKELIGDGYKAYI
jgi:hypothetical protein